MCIYDSNIIIIVYFIYGEYENASIKTCIVAMPYLPCKSKLFNSMFSCYGNTVEEAKSHSVCALSMMSRRPANTCSIKKLYQVPKWNILHTTWECKQLRQYLAAIVVNLMRYSTSGTNVRDYLAVHGISHLAICLLDS